MRDRAELEELLAVEALGGLEPDGRARLTQLLDDNSDAQAEIDQLREGFAETAAMLGTGLPPTELSADLEQRTVSAAIGVATPVESARRWRPAIVAVAAAVVLIAVGALAGYFAAPRSDVEAFINQPGATFIPFESSPGGTGTMTLVVAADKQSAYVIGADVTAPPSGDVYELWTIHGKTPTSLGCLVPDDGLVSQKVAGDFAAADVAAMTVESSACPPAPTTDPVQVATL
jgi:anti-sigma-K factor RskA